MFIKFSAERGDHHFGEFGGPDPLFLMLLYKSSHITSHSPGGGTGLHLEGAGNKAERPRPSFLQGRPRSPRPRGPGRSYLLAPIKLAELPKFRVASIRGCHKEGTPQAQRAGLFPQDNARGGPLEGNQTN